MDIFDPECMPLQVFLVTQPLRSSSPCQAPVAELMVSPAKKVGVSLVLQMLWNCPKNNKTHAGILAVLKPTRRWSWSRFPQRPIVPIGLENPALKLLG